MGHYWRTENKDDAVQLRVHLVRIEDSQDRHGVCGAERRAKDETLEQRQRERLEVEERPEVDDDAHNNRADKRARKGKRQDDAEVAKEVLLQGTCQKSRRSKEGRKEGE